MCGDDFELVDISADTALEERYRTWIPLVKVDGVERYRYEVDGDGLRELLARPADGA